VWRRLRRLGAVALHDAVWVLPLDGKTREDAEWLAEEIEEQGGTALLWEATSLDAGQDARIAAALRAAADERYAGIAAAAGAIRRAVARHRAAPAVQAALRQLRGLERALRLERRRDHFRASGRKAAEMAVREATAAVESSAGPGRGATGAA
jgi:ChrB-like protein